jgi:hypothetical protein
VKNYSKAIIKYVGDNQKIVEELFEKLESKLDYHYFNASLQKKKLSISTVGQLY